MLSSDARVHRTTSQGSQGPQDGAAHQNSCKKFMGAGVWCSRPSFADRF